jgi:hypothetical protein
MSTAAVADARRRRPDVTVAMHELVADIDRIVGTACEVRQRVRRDPDKQMAAQALDDMIHLLAEVKLRLRIDASGNHRF